MPNLATDLARVMEFAKDQLQRHVDMLLPECECEGCPECGLAPHQCSETTCAQTCQCHACDHCLSADAIQGLTDTIATLNTRAASGGLNEPFGNPEQFDVNEPSGDSGQLASLEQRAPRLGQLAEPPYLIQPPGCRYTPREVGRMLANRVVQPHYAEWLVHKAITAALANQQGVGANNLQEVAYFRWLMRGKNLDLAAALMAKDQYATLRRLCESLVPLDDAPTQPAGDVGPEPVSKSVARRLAVQRGEGDVGSQS